ncbi:MAG: TIGR01212 family radical SAM protein [Lachnospiraceae bacterium]|nr:TIGR01212 family radical SAM protein [Lachnospiraceae bacterium]
MGQINTLNNYYKNTFGSKVYKISLNGNMTCPNRDGTIRTGGCIFCSKGGSGDFAASHSLSIPEQIIEAKNRVSKKITSGKYIAYFQAFTNTYAPVHYLKKIYYEAIKPDDIVGLSIATRPDCINEEVLLLLKEINTVKPVFIELGLQSIHQKTADFIRRGYDLECFNRAVYALSEIGVNIVVHLIIGLPNETLEDILASIRHLNSLPFNGVKLQLLHVLENTDLADYYLDKSNNFETLTMDEYIFILGECIEHLRPDIIIHRMTGDGAKKELIAPLWSADKKNVLNSINRYFNKNDITQGKRYV